jgi:hypothetical protein
METIVPVFRLWTLGLHSASMSFKLLAFKALSELINSCRTAFLSLPFLPPSVVTSSVPILPSLPLVLTDNSVSVDKGVKADISEEVTKGAKGSKGDANATHEIHDIHPNTQTKTIITSDTSPTSACLADSMCLDNHPHTNRTALLNVLETCLSMLPVPRLRATAAKRLWHEIEDFPSYSRYLQVKDNTLHHTTLHYTTLHYTTLHYTALHYTTLHCTTLQYMPVIQSNIQLEFDVDSKERKLLRLLSNNSVVTSAFLNVFSCVTYL